MKLKPYPEYEDSGIEWIGEIPEGWEVRKLKFISRLFGRIGFRGYTVSDLVEEGKGALTIGGKHISKNQKLDLSSPEYLSWEKYKESPEIMIEQSNILITQRGTLGKVVLIDKDIGPATINPSMILIKEIKLLSEYLYYFLVSDFSIQEVALINSQTAVPMISQEQADNFHIIFPRNEQDQTAIASFLDKRTARFDALIEKDKKLIALLKEKRTALINHAVTKGLDPNVKLKDSGVEWIGEIPEGWEVRRLRFNALVNPSGKKALSDPKLLVNFLPMEKVSENGEYDTESEAEYQDVSSGYTYFEDNDILVAKITPCFENGKGTLVNNLEYGFGFGTTEFHVIRSYDQLDSKYLFYLTKTHLFRVTGETFMEGAA